MNDKCLDKWEEINLPHGEQGKEKIVGICNFRGDVIIATEFRVLRMTEDYYNEIMFNVLECN